MSTNFPTREVTKILIYEVSLIEQREWFAELLGINPARRKQLGNNFNTGNISEMVKTMADALRRVDDLSRHAARVPHLSKPFVGRTQKKKELISNKTVTNGCIIYGPDGIGKTQFVLKTFEEEGISCHFLNGESITNLRASLEMYARELNCNIKKGGREKSLTRLFKSVCDRKNGTKLVTVIDGLNGNDDELTEVINNFSQHCPRVNHFFVITTRNTNLHFNNESTRFWSYLELPVFTNEEADQFVKTILADENAHDIRELNEELGNYPNLINQAVWKIEHTKYTKRGLYSIRNFLTYYLKIKKTLEEINVPISTIMQVVIYQLFNFENPDKGLAAPILELLAFVKADGIRLTDLKTISHYWQGIDVSRVEESIGWLNKYSCISDYTDSGSSDRIISINPSLQDVVKLCLRKLYPEENMEALRLKHFFDKLPLNFIETSQPSRLAQLAGIWQIFSKAYLTTYHIPHEMAKHIHDRYEKLGLFSSAESFIFDQLDKFIDILGNDDLGTLAIRKICGIAKRNVAKFPVAETLFREVLDQERRQLVENVPETLDIEHWIVSMLWRQKKREQAETEIKDLIERCKAAGVQTIEMKAKHVLGLILGDQKKFKNSLQIHVEVLNWRQKKLPRGHNDIVASLHNIAYCKYKLKNYDGAISDFMYILGNFSKSRTFADYLRSKYWIIMCVSEKVGESRPEILSRCISKLTELLGSQKFLLRKNHPHILDTDKSIKNFQEKLSKERICNRTLFFRDVNGFFLR
ncbi:uncharacterized protein LOC118433085 isoform X2 [Folsomia candida]|uniref:uncharacterized protein LOC118433085 isoform X2 n=1 Tax=Folsomia candida TaxID=158441 RepID=UPI00160531B4|nr:uncharacterized protein LOC118433085 isoform X2 [Folsomia candida]